MTYIDKAIIRDSQIETQGTAPVDLSKMEVKDNKATTMDNPSDTTYPTTKAVSDFVGTKISSVYKFMGSITANQFDLLIHQGTGYETVEKGWVYNVTEKVTYDSKEYPAGTNFAVEDPSLNPRKMDALAGIMDISGKLNTLFVNGTQPVRIPYFFEVIYENGKATVKDYTITADNAGTLETYNLDINAAIANTSETATDGKAGLMTAADKYKLDNMGSSGSKIHYGTDVPKSTQGNKGDLYIQRYLGDE